MGLFDVIFGGLRSARTTARKVQAVKARKLACKAGVPYFRDMATLTITAKGQVTFRKELLEHLGVSPGEKILVERMPDGRIEVRAARRPRKISDIFGILKQENGPRLTIEEIKEFAAKGWAGER